MALEHASPGDVVTLLPTDLTQRSHALFKGHHLQVLRLVLQTDERFPPHRVPGEITIQCLLGELVVGHPEGKATLHPGEWLHLEGGALHDLLALQESVALVTIALPPQAASQAGSPASRHP
jgi:quercetin dioxygenase-like cupin family protein